MALTGMAHKLGDRVSTDIHVSIKHRAPETSQDELCRTMFRELDPELAGRLKPGDFIVAGEHFGTLSTFDDAIVTLKNAGVAAVIARSFSHLFYRSAINGGLPIIEADTSSIDSGDCLAVDLEGGVILNQTKGTQVSFQGLPPVLLKLLNDGGVFRHVQAHGGYRV